MFRSVDGLEKGVVPQIVDGGFTGAYPRGPDVFSGTFGPVMLGSRSATLASEAMEPCDGVSGC
jgi:hypothetical protein